MVEFLKFIGGGFAIVIGFALALMYWVIVPLERAQCAGFAQESGFQTRYVHLGPGSYECLVKLESGRWIPYSQLRHDSR